MIEKALIDADIVSYRCAAANANEDVSLACWQAGEMVQRIIHETNAAGYICYLTGSDNFRYDVYPEYKAHRKDKPKPAYLEPIREYLVTTWNAKVTHGIEADDAMGIEQTNSIPETSVICTIDKDLLQIPGKHYNFVKKEHMVVSPLQGLRFFYYQLIMGDKADNIFGYDGKARDKVPKFLQADIDAIYLYEDEWEMFSHVRDLYNDDERLLMNGRVLKIQQKEGELWEFPGQMLD